MWILRFVIGAATDSADWSQGLTILN